MSKLINNDIFQYKDEMSLYNFKTVYNNFLIELSDTGVFNYILNPRLKFFNQGKCFAWNYPDGSLTQTTSYTQFVLNQTEEVSQDLTNLLYSDQEYSFKIICKSNKDLIVKIKADQNIFIDQNGNTVDEITLEINQSDDFEKYATYFSISDVSLKNVPINLKFISQEDNTILQLKEVIIHKGMVQFDDLRHYGWFESNVRYNGTNWELTNDGINYHRIITNDDWYAQDWLNKHDYWMDYAVNDNIEKGICVSYDKDKHKLNFDVNLNALELNPRLKSIVKYQYIDLWVQKSGKDVIEINYDYINENYYPIFYKFGDGSYLKITYNFNVKKGGKYQFDKFTFHDCIGNIYEEWKFEYNFENNIILLDETDTTKAYELYIKNKEIKLKKIDFKDEYFSQFHIKGTDNKIYKIYIENEQLKFKEIKPTDYSPQINTIYLQDVLTVKYYNISCNGTSIITIQSNPPSFSPLIKSIKKTNISDYDGFSFLPLTELSRDKLSFDVKNSNFNITNVEYDENKKPRRIYFDNGDIAELGYSKVSVFVNDEHKQKLKITRISLFDLNRNLKESWKYLYYQNGKLAAIENTYMADKYACEYMKENDFDFEILHSEYDTEFEYDINGKLSKVKYENGDYINILRYENKQIIEYKCFDKNNNLIQDWKLTRNEYGKIISIKKE